MTQSNKKFAATLNDLAATYSDRREGDLALLRERGKEIPALVASLLSGLAEGQYVRDAETEALVVLLRVDRVETYLASVEAVRSLSAIRDREASSGVPASGVLARETTTEKEASVRVLGAKPTSPATTTPGKTSVGSIPSVADRLNKTALGRDLAATVVEPSELLAFLSFRMRRSVVLAGASAAAQRHLLRQNGRSMAVRASTACSARTVPGRPCSNRCDFAPT